MSPIPATIDDTLGLLRRAGYVAGRDLANPSGLIHAAAMMLDHVKRTDLGDRLRKAINETLNVDNVRTGDLGARPTS